MANIEQDAAKRLAAARALSFVQPGMRLGLGTGSTARIFVDLLADRAEKDGLTVRCVPTSEATRRQAQDRGLDVTDLDACPELDLTVDGADEFDSDLTLIKGGGGALLREKIVAAASARMVVVTDSSKRVARLGRFPLPVEVNRFGLGSTSLLVRRALERTGHSGEIVLRRGADGEPFQTDGNHLILDCHLGAIFDAPALAAALVEVPGVVEHGLFIGYAHTVVTVENDVATVIERPATS